jgi:hypothetical protein
VDVGAAHGTGGVEVSTWGVVEVVGAVREAAEVSEVDDGGAAQGWAVGSPAPVPQAV